MIRPGYLGEDNILKARALKLAAKKLKIKEPAPIKVKSITNITESIKNPIEGVIRSASLNKSKVVRLQETAVMPGMTTEEYLNAAKQQKVIATPEININHPLYHDLDALQKKTLEKQKKKIDKRRKLYKRWSSRPEIILRWYKENKIKEIGHSNLLKQWDKEDKDEQKQRLKIRPSKALKQDWAEKDSRKRAMRAYSIIKKEEKDIEILAKKEKTQKRSDWLYSLFRRFYGWPERSKPKQ